MNIAASYKMNIFEIFEVTLFVESGQKIDNSARIKEKIRFRKSKSIFEKKHLRLVLGNTFEYQQDQIRSPEVFHHRCEYACTQTGRQHLCFIIENFNCRNIFFYTGQ